MRNGILETWKCCCYRVSMRLGIKARESVAGALLTRHRSFHLRLLFFFFFLLFQLPLARRESDAKRHCTVAFPQESFGGRAFPLSNASTLFSSRPPPLSPYCIQHLLRARSQHAANFRTLVVRTVYFNQRNLFRPSTRRTLSVPFWPVVTPETEANPHRRNFLFCFFYDGKNSGCPMTNCPVSVCDNSSSHHWPWVAIRYSS